MKISEHAVSAYPLLKAIAAAAGRDVTQAELAEASGRSAKNLPRDLDRLVEVGWISREPGSRPDLTDEGRDVVARIERANADDGAAVTLPLHLIDEDPDLNPRKTFGEAEMAELTASVGDKGVQQPILVRPSPEPGRFKVVAGARRRRAAIAAGLFTIPAVVRELNDAQALEAAIVENVQRSDMSPIDEAKAFERLIDAAQADEPGLSLKDAKQRVADTIRKTVRHVEMRLDLLELPDFEQARMALPEDDENRLGVKEARQQIQWKRKRDKERAARIMPAGELLHAAEIVEALETRPTTPKGWYYGGEAIWVRPGEALDELKPLVDRGLLRVKRGFDGDCKIYLSLYAWEGDEIWAQLDAWATEARLEPGVDRAGKLAALRAAVLAERNLLLPASWTLATSCLEGKPTKCPDLVAEKRENDQRDREWRRRQADEERDRKAAKAREERLHARDTGEEGEAFFARVQAFEAEAGGLEPEAFMTRFFALLASYGIDGPYIVVPIARDPGGSIVDGRGEDTVSFGKVREARRRLICLAMNFAAGLAPTSGPPLPQAQEPETPARPAADDEDEDGDEPGDDEPPADDEDEADDVEAQADEDEEIPGFLRRLAGGGGGRRSAEARP